MEGSVVKSHADAAARDCRAARQAHPLWPALGGCPAQFIRNHARRVALYPFSVLHSWLLFASLAGWLLQFDGIPADMYNWLPC
jgi:hypothetical protein